MGDKERDYCPQTISWMSSRSINIRHLKCSRFTDDIAVKIAEFGSSLHWLMITSGIMDPTGGKRYAFLKPKVHREWPVITDIGMVKMLEGRPNLRTLDMSLLPDTNITDESIVRLAECCPYLQDLNMSHSRKITDSGLLRLAEKKKRWCEVQKMNIVFYSNLQSLNMEMCEGITAAGVLGIVEGCPNLHSLSLRFRGSILNDESVIKIAESCPQLRLLDLVVPECFESYVTDASIIKLAECCHDLQSLSVSGCLDVTDISILKIVESCPNIHKLELGKCYIQDLELIKIGQSCPNFTVLNS
mmetsp:Transcript_25376/g.24277  ORF Transcript_25376/g.24277 Transcript_25376/m.24277 type:complete len:301 (-) Transcript_25376:4-906(-)